MGNGISVHMEAGCPLVTDWHAGCVDRERLHVRCYGGNSRQSRAWLFPEKEVFLCVCICVPLYPNRLVKIQALRTKV